MPLWFGPLLMQARGSRLSCHSSLFSTDDMNRNLNAVSLYIPVVVTINFHSKFASMIRKGWCLALILQPASTFLTGSDLTFEVMGLPRTWLEDWD